jgi:hypothetical protein
VLSFVAAHHVFTPENGTIDAIRYAYAATKPLMDIVEGFPSALGRSPEQILESVRRRQNPNADSFAKGEVAYTVTLAQDGNVPFMGGEPTVLEEIGGLVAKGYRRDDVLFAFRLKGLGYARATGTMPTGNASAFTARYEQEARQLVHATRTEPATEAQFIADYVRIVGVDPISNVELPARSNPGTETLLQRLAADNMRFRDEHLLEAILRQLAEHDRVLLVYCGSHWTTLSRALQSRLCRPVIRVEGGKALHESP